MITENLLELIKYESSTWIKYLRMLNMLKKKKNNH